MSLVINSLSRFPTISLVYFLLEKTLMGLIKTLIFCIWVDLSGPSLGIPKVLLADLIKTCTAGPAAHSLPAPDLPRHKVYLLQDLWVINFSIHFSLGSLLNHGSPSNTPQFYLTNVNLTKIRTQGRENERDCNVRKSQTLLVLKMEE